jgi:hypothetical protein
VQLNKARDKIVLPTVDRPLWDQIGFFDVGDQPVLHPQAARDHRIFQHDPRIGEAKVVLHSHSGGKRFAGDRRIHDGTFSG